MVAAQSARSARIGEIDAARRAGMIAATNAHAPSDNGADRERQRIPELHAVELRGEQVAGADGQRQPEHEPEPDAPERAAQHHADDVAAAGAERHADADLVGPLRDGVGRDAVEPDRREHERDDPEQPREARHGALLIERRDPPAAAASARWSRSGSRSRRGQHALHLRLERAGGSSVTSSSPRTKCDADSTRFIIGFV